MASRVLRVLSGLLILPALLLGGCDVKKQSEWLADLRPKCEPLRAQLRQIAATLPPPSAQPLEARSAKLSPKPILKEKGDGNLVFFNVLELTDPWVEIDKNDDLKLYLTGGLGSVLRQTATNTKVPSYISDVNASRDFYDELDAMRTAVRYLGVYRVAKILPAFVGRTDRFDSSNVVAEFFVYDLKDGKLLAQWSLDAKSAETVYYSYKKGASDAVKQDRLEESVRGTMTEALRQALYESLPARIGGEYQKAKLGS